jgi:gliding motility-associated-like protein
LRNCFFSKKALVKFRIILVIFFSFYGVDSLRAQSWVWAASAGGTQACESNSIAADLSGNAYVTGTFYNPSATFGSVILNSNGLRDAFLVKYDASGNPVWGRGAGGTGNDHGKCVTTDNSGNVYVAGYFNSATITLGPYTLTNTNGNCSDMFLAKYDSAGTILWATSAGGTSCEIPGKIVTDATGNVYVSGQFSNSAIQFGTTVLPNLGSQDLFLAKYDPLGNVIWAIGAGSTGTEKADGVAIDPSGNVYVSGAFSNTINFGFVNLVSDGGTDAFVAKYNSLGNIIWAKKSGGIYGDMANDVTVDAAGYVYCTGSFSSDSIHFGNAISLVNSGFGWDMFVCKYSPTGNLIWAQNGGGTGDDHGYDIGTDVVGNIYVAGEFNFPAFTMASTSIVFPTGGFHPMFLAQFDPNGNVGCISSLSSGGNICSIDVDPSGNVFASCGYFANSNPAFVIGADSFPNTGIERVFVAKRGNPIRLITSTLSSCITNSGIASASIIGGDDLAYAYNWSPVGGNDSVANGLAAGIYTLTVTDPENCVSTLTVQISNISTPVVTVSSSGGVNPGDSTLLQASGGISYAWSPASGLSCDTCSDPVAFPYQTTNYCVTVADTNNCTAIACLRVEVNDCPVYIPNAFSPNGDNQNDFECVRSRCISALHFSVYDRWGKKVFESFSQEFCWDGTYEGNALESAVYTFTMEAVLLSGNEIRKSGTISLIK